MNPTSLRLVVVAIMLLLGTACAPKYPNDEDHQSGDCVECHFHGDGPTPPDDHWDGAGNVTWDHSKCDLCHVPG